MKKIKYFHLCPFEIGTDVIREIEVYPGDP